MEVPTSLPGKLNLVGCHHYEAMLILWTFSCALQPLAGKIYSQFSTKVSYLSGRTCSPSPYLTFPKYTFMAFVAIFELGSLLCGVAQSSKMLIVGRAVA